MAREDLKKEQLYESVKTLLETEEKHIHLPQQKLYTLFSVAFQYMVYRSTKEKGVYLIRIEDSQLTDKICRNAKDPSTRKFLRALMLPRKLKYGKSVFYLDFFHLGSWSITQDIDSSKFKGAIIVKNTSEKLMMETSEEDEASDQMVMPSPNFYLESLVEFIPKTITIAYDHYFEGLKEIEFPFIKKTNENISGITVSKEIDLDSIKD